MHVMSYSELRKNLANTMDLAHNNAESIIITRERGNKSSCVLMSLDEYQSLQETAYLLRSPENAKNLLDSLEQLKKGQGKKRELIE